MIRAILLLVLSNPLSLTEHSSVEIIEVNTVLESDTLLPRLCQIIFWSRDDLFSRYGVRDYRMRTDATPTTVNGNCLLVFWDGRDDRFRVVRCRGWIRTTTITDPEMRDRAFQDVGERQSLPK